MPGEDAHLGTARSGAHGPPSPRIAPALPIAALTAAGAWPIGTAETTGDYSLLAAPYLDAASSGDLAGLMAGPISMGPLALIARLPTVLLAAALDAGELARYRAGAIPCVAALAALALAYAKRAQSGGASWPIAASFAGIALVNPFATEAINTGHPEELLTASLLVGAALVAPTGRWRLAGVLLGLAIATKQWALVGVFPVALAAPALRARLLALAAAVAILLYAPFALAHPDRFYSVQEAAASASPSASFANVFWPFLAEGPRVTYRDGQKIALSETRRTPRLLTRAAHPAIVILPALLALVAYLRRSLSASNVLALLTVALLLRSVLDPIDNAYYHLPALIALLAFESGRRFGRWPPLPLLSLAMALMGWLTFLVLPGRLSLAGLNAFYLAWSLPLLAVMLWFAFARAEGRS